MKRTPASTIGAIGFVFLVLGLTWCSNPFKHFNHTGGIAYYKQGLLPFVSKEIDVAVAPFTITGSLKDSAFAGNEVAVIPVNADSLGLSFVAGGKRHLFILATGGQLNTDFFTISVVAKPGNRLNVEHDVYYFKFLE